MSTCRVSRITRLVDSLIGTCTVTALIRTYGGQEEPLHASTAR